MNRTQPGDWRVYGGRAVCLPRFAAPIAVEWTQADAERLARQERAANVRRWFAVGLALLSGAALTFALAMATGGF